MAPEKYRIKVIAMRGEKEIHEATEQAIPQQAPWSSCYKKHQRSGCWNATYKGVVKRFPTAYANNCRPPVVCAFGQFDLTQ